MYREKVCGLPCTPGLRYRCLCYCYIYYYDNAYMYSKLYLLPEDKTTARTYSYSAKCVLRRMSLKLFRYFCDVNNKQKCV